MAASGKGYVVRPVPRFGIGLTEFPRLLGELWAARDLIWTFTKRDLTARYRGSILGVLWTLASPLLLTVVFTVVFTILLPGNQIPYFPLFILIGLLAWNLHSASCTGGIYGLLGASGIISKVYFPRAVIPISTVLALTVNFILGQVIVVAFALVLGVPLTWAWLAFPFVLAIQVAFSIGFAMIFGTLYVFFRDTAMVLDTVLFAWLFATPVFYQTQDLVPDYARIVFILNPVATVITAYREIILAGNPPDGLFMARAAVQALVILGVGIVVFFRFSPRFAEEL